MGSSNNIMKVKFIGMFFIILMGLGFHDLYKSTNSFILGIISPVNESKWEHWKMVFWPMIIISIVEYYFIKDHVANYIFSLAAGIIVFELITFGSIELYDFFVGKSHILIHVTTFLAGAVAGQMTRYFFMFRTVDSKILLVFGIFILAVQFLALTFFTFQPPTIEYFRDSIKGTYGIFEKIS